MGDFLSPKRKDVVERLRRRIDLYRRRQNGINQRFEPCINQIYEQSRQETLHLHQKWQDSRAKKAKQSKSKDTCSTGESKSSCQTKHKRKFENTTSENQPPGVGNADNPASPSSKKSKTNSDNNSNRIPSVSVQIVQQITPQSENTQIKTNVTFSSTFNTQINNSNDNKGNNVASNIQTSTNIQCKTEPKEEPQNETGSTTSSQTTDSPNLGIDGLDLDELQSILDRLEREDGEIPLDLLEHIDKITEDTDKLVKEHEEKAKFNKDISGFNSIFQLNTAFSASPDTPGSVPDQQGSVQAPTGPMPAASNSLPGKGSPRMQTPSFPEPFGQVHRPPNSGNIHMPMGPTLPPYRGPLGGDLLNPGPAAETLKQMAAQHQSQQQQYEQFQKPPFPDPYTRTGSFPNSNYPNTYGRPDFQFNQQTAPGAVNPGYRAPSGAPLGIKSEYETVANSQLVKGEYNYSSTKPLTHYPDQSNPGMSSSLQQLQNQVQTFAHSGQPNHAPRMQISQSQQMQLNASSQRMQLSQSQQMHVTGSAQQISVAQQQSFAMTQNRVRPQSQPPPYNEQMNMSYMSEKFRASQMQEQTQMFGQRVMNPNYAQTAPNMHAAIRPPSNQGFKGIKTEIGQIQGMPHSMNGQMHARALTPPSVPNSSMISYSSDQQLAQRPPQYSSAVCQSATSVPNQANKAPTSAISNAIMYGPRPPNVNVGPNGLNISHQRMPDPNWNKMQQPAGCADSAFIVSQQQQIQSSSLQHFPPGYQNPPAPIRGQMHPPTMQQGPANNQISQSRQRQMIMHNMQMQEQLHARSQQSIPPAGSMTNTPMPQGANYPPTGTEYPIDFLEGGNYNNTSNPSDFNLIDELFGVKN